jgi:hypothetical protein
MTLQEIGDEYRISNTKPNDSFEIPFKKPLGGFLKGISKESFGFVGRLYWRFCRVVTCRGDCIGDSV